jgi:hypothetical protein
METPQAIAIVTHEVPLTDTELIELAGLVKNLQDKINYYID